MILGAECLFQVGDGISNGRPCGHLGSGLPGIDHRAFPEFTPEGVVGKSLDMFDESIPMELLDCPHEVPMKRAPSLLQHTLVGNLVRQGVFEGVLEIGEKRDELDFGRLFDRKVARSMILDSVSTKNSSLRSCGTSASWRFVRNSSRRSSSAKRRVKARDQITANRD